MDTLKLRFLTKTEQLYKYADSHDTISLFEITQGYGSSIAYPLVLLFCILTAILPLWFLIFSCPALLYLGFIIITQKNIWIPDFLKKIYFSKQTLQSTLYGVIKFFSKIRQFLINRGSYTFDYPWLESLNGWLVILTAVEFMICSIQHFPGSILWPSLALALVALGEILNDDGYCLTAGYMSIVIIFIYTLSLFFAMFAMPASVWMN